MTTSELESIPLNKINPNAPEAQSKGSLNVDENSAMIRANQIENQSTESIDVSNWSLWIKPTIYMAAYFTINLVLTIHTKWLLSRTDFSFPWILSGLHIFVSSLGAWLTLRLGNRKHEFVKLTKSLITKIGLFSALYSINIAMSNVSMKYVSLAFHQVSRSATPIITLILEYFILGKKAGKWCVASLIPVVAGIILTVVGEFKGMDLTTFGLFLTVFGIILSSLKGVMTNFLLVAGFKMHPLELIALLGPFASLQCVIASIITGEAGAIYRQYHGESFNSVLVFGLIINAGLAFLMNWISFAANKETSALAMTVAGNVKQAASVGFSMILFNTKLHLLDGMGIIITLIGGGWYSVIALNEKRRKTTHHLIISDKASDKSSTHV